MDKSYVISVSVYAGCYRHIQIGERATLHSLHRAILGAFEFDDDHAHAFFMDNKYWSNGNAYFSSGMDVGDRRSRDYRLERFHFAKGDAFKYLFDFGDEWRFQCKVLRVLEERTDIPRVIRSVGESPEQYPSYEEEWEDEEWEAAPWNAGEPLEGCTQEEEDEEEEDPPLTQEELDELYAATGLELQTAKDIARYLKAAARFYGLISLEALYDLYAAQNPPVDKNLFFKAAIVSEMENPPYVLLPQDVFADPADCPELTDVVAEYLLDPEEPMMLARLRRLQKGKPLKILPREEFLPYETPFWHPNTPQSAALLAFLKTKEEALTQDAQTICGDIQDQLMADVSVPEILDQMPWFGCHIDPKTEAVEFVRLMDALERVIPKHANRGHTAEEMKNSSRQKNLPLEDQLSFF